MAERTVAILQEVAAGLDQIFNDVKRGAERTNGFVLLVFPFDRPRGARVNYVSNADREEILVALKEIVARFEGRVQETEVQQ